VLHAAASHEASLATCDARSTRAMSGRGRAVSDRFRDRVRISIPTLTYSLSLLSRLQVRGRVCSSVGRGASRIMSRIRRDRTYIYPRTSRARAELSQSCDTVKRSRQISLRSAVASDLTPLRCRTQTHRAPLSKYVLSNEDSTHDRQTSELATDDDSHSVSGHIVDSLVSSELFLFSMIPRARAPRQDQ
jgi:hypothetical protein